VCCSPFFNDQIFGLLAYYNIRQLSHREVPIVRRRHEVQLTVMILVQVVFNLFATTPCFVVLTFASSTILTQNSVIAIKVRFATAVTICMYYLYYAVNIHSSKNDKMIFNLFSFI